MKWGSWLWLVSITTALPPNPELNKLNNVLDGVIFGADPGPCPNEADPCIANVENMPDWAKDITVNIFFIDWKLGDILQSGVVEAWGVEFASLSFDDIQLNKQQLENVGSDQRIPLLATIDDTRLGATAKARFTDLAFKFSIFEFTASGSTTVNLNKDDMRRDGRGITANFKLDFISSDFSEKPPRQLQISQCRVTLGNGISLDNLKVQGFPERLTDFVGTILLAVFKGFIQNLICEIITQLAVLSDGRDGLINLLLNDLNQQVDELVAEGLTSLQDWQAFERENAPPNAKDVLDIGNTQVSQNALILAADLVSAPSTLPRYVGRPTINEIMDVLIGDETGVALVKDLKETFFLDKYPSAFLSTSLVDIDAQLLGIRIGGLNSFSKFNILSLLPAEASAPNRFLRYTLQHQLSMDVFDPQVDVRIQLSPGLWVNKAGAQKTENFDFTVGLRLQDVNLDLTTYSRVLPDELLALQVGQIAGPAREVSEVLYCLVPMLDAFSLNGMNLRVTNIDNLRLFNLYDLETLVGQVLDFVNTALKPTFALQLPFIFENFVRGELNNITASLLQAPAPCSPYQSTPFQGNDRYLTLADSAWFTSVLYALNNLIGGDPVTRNPLDINNLVEAAIIQFFGPTLKDNGVYLNGPGSWTINETLAADLRGSSETKDFTYLALHGAEIRESDSVWKLVFEPVGLFGISFDLFLGNGTVVNQDGQTERRGLVQIRIPISVNSTIDGILYAEDKINLDLEIGIVASGLVDAKLNRDNLFLSTITDLIDHPTCFLALLDEKSLPELSAKLSGIKIRATTALDEFSNSRYGPILRAWSNSLSRPGVQENTAKILNAFLKIGTSVAQKEFPSLLGDFDIAKCQEQTIQLNLTVPSLSDIAEVFNQATTTQENPQGKPPSLWETSMVPASNEKVWTITEETSGYIPFISDIVSDPTIIRQTMILFANTTSDPLRPSVFDALYDALILEADETVSLQLNPEDLVGKLVLNEFFNVSCTKVLVNNIDGLRAITLLEPYEAASGERARFTTTNTFGYDPNVRLQTTIMFEITMASSVFTEDPSDTGILTEMIEISVDIQGLTLETLFSAAVKEETMKQTQLGQIFSYDPATKSFQIRNGAWCDILSFIFENGIYFAQFQTFIRSFQGPTIKVEGDLLNDETKDVVTGLIEMVVKTLRSQLPNASQGPLRDLVNEVLRSMTSTTAREEACRNVQPPRLDYTGEFIDPSQYATSFASFIQSDLLNPSSAFNINKILAELGTALGELQGPLFEFNQSVVIYNGANLGAFGFSLNGLSIQGFRDVAGVQGLKLLDTSAFTPGDYKFRTLVEISGPVTVEGSISFMSDGLFTGPAAAAVSTRSSSDGYIVQNDLKLSMTIDNLVFGVDAMARVDINALMNVYAGNLLGLYSKPTEVPCLLQVFDLQGLRLFNLTAASDQIELGVACGGTCTSPFLENLERGGEKITTDEAVSQKIFEILKSSSAFLESFEAQQYIDEAIETAKEECVGVSVAFNFTEEEELASAADVMWLGSLGYFAAVVLGFGFLGTVHRKRSATIHKILDLEEDQRKMSATERELHERRLRSLHGHPAVSRTARILVPVSFVLVTVLFLIANFFTVGVDVQLKLQVLGDETMPVNLLSFSLKSSIDDMWHAQTYWLALIIFVASGLWPHTKTLILVFSWFAPTTILSEKKRGSVLHLMDILGKWSLIDAYVMFMLQVAFRFFITTSFIQDLAWLPDDLVVVDVVVLPGASIYFFVIATGAALLLSHYMIYYHRHIVENDRTVEDSLQNPPPKIKPGATKVRAALHNHVFSIPDTNLNVFGFARTTKGALLTLNVLTLVIILVSLFVPLMKFEFRGLAGFAIGVVKPELATVTHSAASIATAMTDGIEGVLNNVGVRFLQMMFVCFTFLTPVLLTLSLMILFFIPLTVQDQRRMLFMAEIFAAWDALIVLFISVISAIFQISDLAQWIVRSSTGVYCTQLVDPLLAFLGVNPTDAKCFDVIATIEGTGWLLAVAVFLSIINSTIMFKLLRAGLEDRETALKGRLELYGKCPTEQGCLLRRFMTAEFVVTELPYASTPVSERTKKTEVYLALSRNKTSTSSSSGSSTSRSSKQQGGNTMHQMLSARNPIFDQPSRNSSSSLLSTPSSLRSVRRAPQPPPSTPPTAPGIPYADLPDF